MTTIIMIEAAVRANFVLDPQRKAQMYGHREFEDRPTDPVCVFIGLCNQYGLVSGAVARHLGMQMKEYKYKLMLFRERYNNSTVQLLDDLEPDESSVRFKNKVRMCQNHIMHHRGITEYVRLEELV